MAVMRSCRTFPHGSMTTAQAQSGIIIETVAGTASQGMPVTVGSLLLASLNEPKVVRRCAGEPVHRGFPRITWFGGLIVGPG